MRWALAMHTKSQQKNAMIGTLTRQDLTGAFGKTKFKAAAAALGKATQDRVDHVSDKWADADPPDKAKEFAASAASRAGDALPGLSRMVVDAAEQWHSVSLARSRRRFIGTWMPAAESRSYRIESAAG